MPEFTGADAYRSPEPVDRLTALGDEVMTFLQTQSTIYRKGDKLIVCVHGQENIGGMAIFGYDTDQEAVEDLMEYLRRILGTMGKGIIFTKTHGN